MTDQPDVQQVQTASRDNSTVIDLREYKKNKDPLPVTFHRRELDAILRIYGRMVGEGEWRDYAIDHLQAGGETGCLLCGEYGWPYSQTRP